MRNSSIVLCIKLKAQYLHCYTVEVNVEDDNDDDIFQWTNLLLLAWGMIVSSVEHDLGPVWLRILVYPDMRQSNNPN